MSMPISKPHAKADPPHQGLSRTLCQAPCLILFVSSNEGPSSRHQPAIAAVANALPTPTTDLLHSEFLRHIGTQSTSVQAAALISVNCP